MLMVKGRVVIIDYIIQKFRIQVLSIREVEDSHSSTVYKCHLLNGDTVFIKLPFTKLKFERNWKPIRF